MSHNDTIVAQATPPGRGGVGILRISGLKARDVAQAVLGKLPKPRYADYLPFKDTDGTPLDQGIALWFPGPNSFTGEDVLELQGHGGPVILDLLLKRILTLPGVRIARPGEFSERAFLNDKLDLAQAEAIADLIDASSEQAARSALNSLQGAFSARVNHLVEAEVVDTRLQVLEVGGQEILTKDKVNLRLNLAANWRYSDVLQAFGQLTKPLDHLYRELQFALREAVGTRTLDELLEDKKIIDEVVSAQVTERMAAFGIDVASLGVKDIVLPGDMKAILSQLVEAEKSAQANVIRRREETAATRSLLNTAKVMENNPVALRLKELETLERVAERIDKISVFGGLDQVLHGLVNLKG